MGSSTPTESPKPKVVIIVQARMGSSRLPGKVLLHAGRWTLLEHLVKRVRSSGVFDELLIATTEEPADDAIVSAAAALDTTVFRGSTADVLDRYYRAATSVDAQVVVRVTGDCPLLDPREIDRLVTLFLSASTTDLAYDFVTNQAGPERRIPIGYDVEVFSMAALERAHREATDPGDREHVTPYLYRIPEKFRTLVSDPPGPDMSHLRLTVDTPEDLELVTAIIESVGEDATSEEIASFLEAHPETVEINAHIRQKGYDSEYAVRRRRIDGRTLIGRADGDPKIGLGHVSRLSSLLLAWRELGGKAALVGSGIAGIFRQRLDAAGIAVIDRESTSATELTDLAQSLGACAFAVDGYRFDEGYLRTLSTVAPVLTIDDLADFPNPADVIVNQNLGFDRSKYRVKPGGKDSKILVGSSYVLLRPEFRSSADSSEMRRTKLVVSFGGSDPAKLTLTVTRSLLEACTSILKSKGLEVVVIAGGGIDHDQKAKLEELAGEHQELAVLYDAENMAELFRRSLLAITAAGSTTWELLSCGVVPLCIVVADNQLVVVEKIAEQRAGVDLGWHANLDLDRMMAAVSNLLEDDHAREEMRRRGETLIDGRGVWRSIDALLDALGERNRSGEEEL